MRYFNLASLRILRPSVLSSRTVIPKRSLIQSRVWLQRSSPISRSIMSAAAPAEKREWLCIIPDKPGMLAKRLEIRPTHLANLKPLIEAKQIVTGGPMFNGAHPTEGKPADFKGSMMVLRGATEAEIREIISGDIYTKSDVWDLEKMQIIPVAIVI